MKTSESITKLAPALVKAQAEIKTAVKDATNPHFKSKYADLSAVWDAIKLAVSSNGLAVVQMPTHSEDNRAHLTTRLVHTSGEWIEEEASIPVAKQDAHGYGSAITYLRRYGVSALLGVVADDDDDGNTAVKGNGIASAGMEKHTAAQVAVDAFDDLDAEVQEYCRREAIKIVAMHERGENVGDYVRRQKYDTETKLGLWSLLPSAVRSAVKKQSVPLAEQA